MTEEENLVSVIIPIYNAERTLEKCVNSVLNQDYKNIEVFLVDDGSTDESGEICESFVEKDDRVKVIHKQNGGVSSARNCALDEANGQYIFFADSDDYVAEDIFTQMLSAFEDYDLVICGYTMQYDTGERRERVLEPGNFENKREIAAYLAKYSHIGANALWNKLFLRRLISDRFDEDFSLGEDLKFVLQYLEKCERVRYINKPLYFYMYNGLTSLAYRYNPRMYLISRQSYDSIRQFVQLYYPEADMTMNKRVFITNAMIHSVKVVRHRDFKEKEKYRIIKEIMADSIWKTVFDGPLHGNKAEKLFEICVRCRLTWLFYIAMKVRAKTKKEVSYDK
ncbi:MAG: glycosyltransferase family 2 protein [Bacillota bacterium]|nr:glycosyltransferase family 2 protein [Bacillota bacterium]